MKKTMKRLAMLGFLAVLMSGCSGLGRWWSNLKAESFASDWVVVQYNMDMKPSHCWKLQDTSVTNETSSDGIYWKDGASGHLVHISGWYNRVQVFARNYEHAGRLLGVDAGKCGSGVYQYNSSSS